MCKNVKWGHVAQDMGPVAATVKIKFSLATPCRHMEKADVVLHTFLTSAPDRGE